MFREIGENRLSIRWNPCHFSTSSGNCKWWPNWRILMKMYRLTYVYNDESVRADKQQIVWCELISLTATWEFSLIFDVPYRSINLSMPRRNSIYNVYGSSWHQLLWLSLQFTGLFHIILPSALKILARTFSLRIGNSGFRIPRLCIELNDFRSLIMVLRQFLFD